MDESLRKEMIKQCHKRGEEAKVGIRNVRRDGNEAVRKQKVMARWMKTEENWKKTFKI